MRILDWFIAHAQRRTRNSVGTRFALHVHDYSVSDYKFPSESPDLFETNTKNWSILTCWNRRNWRFNFTFLVCVGTAHSTAHTLLIASNVMAWPRFGDWSTLITYFRIILSSTIAFVYRIIALYIKRITPFLYYADVIPLKNTKHDSPT